MTNARIIGSFQGLKVLALGAIFYWHSALPHRDAWGDIGLHATQFFFVVSGFLVANRYWDEWIGGRCTVSAMVAYFWKKVKVIWPLHVALLVCLVVWNASRQYYLGFDWVQLLVSGLFLQAWTGRLFAWNGPSWFISALLFCYFAAPILIGVIRKDNTALKMLLLVLAVRYGIEWVQISYPNRMWQINFHSYPIVRCLEFYAGALMYPPYRAIRSVVADNKVSRLWFTIHELAVMAILFVIVIPNFFHQIRGSIVLWYCLFVFVFAFDWGYVSRFLNMKPFRVLATVELAFFLLHIPVKDFLRPLFERFAMGPFGAFGLWLALTLLFAFLWQLVVARAYKVTRMVYGVSAVMLSCGILSVLFFGAYNFANRVELVLDQKSRPFLDKTERIHVFYTTKGELKAGHSEHVVSIPVKDRCAFRCPALGDVFAFRIEFQPKKKCKLGRNWPRVEQLTIGGAKCCLGNLSPYYIEKKGRPGLSGKVGE